MGGPATVEFGALLVAQREFRLALSLGEAVPQRQRELSPIGGGELEELG